VVEDCEMLSFYIFNEMILYRVIKVYNRNVTYVITIISEMVNIFESKM
jgi:hypothetical protein